MTPRKLSPTDLVLEVYSLTSNFLGQLGTVTHTGPQDTAECQKVLTETQRPFGTILQSLQNQTCFIPRPCSSFPSNNPHFPNDVNTYLSKREQRGEARRGAPRVFVSPPQSD
ncbi:hypothetical protein J6590_013253 [Homalodisca vitripennis]|nr:hypothetical protein J6590_013253 [Homalodisca vitripennis]